MKSKYYVTYMIWICYGEVEGEFSPGLVVQRLRQFDVPPVVGKDGKLRASMDQTYDKGEFSPGLVVQRLRQFDVPPVVWVKMEN